jgi:hypothetical protein
MGWLQEKLHGGRAEKLDGRSAAWYGRTHVGKPGSTELHVVVACAERKRTSAGEPLRLGSVVAPSLEERCDLWWRQLSRARPSCTALDLYAGDHWAVARQLPDVARAAGFRPHLWVASAGYGLVPADARLASYSATFASESPDTVVAADGDRREATAAWWRALGRRRLRGSSTPRQLAELAGNSRRGSRLLVVLPQQYLQALEDDLVTAVANCGDPAGIVVISSNPGPATPVLQDAWVPAAAPLRLPLGGALTSLHVRVARYLLERLSPTTLEPGAARRSLDKLLERTPGLPRLERTRLGDNGVRAWVRAELRRDASASHTKLLRRLRDTGRACEQSRFRELFLLEARRRR